MSVLYTSHLFTCMLLLARSARSAPLGVLQHGKAVQARSAYGTDGVGQTVTQFVTAWARPNRAIFDETVAPFVPLDDLTFYQLNEAGCDQTTLAAQKIMTIPVETAPGETTQSVATLGDVMILQNGLVAEGLGIIGEGGSQRELLDVIACNTFDNMGNCVLIDYKGRETQAVYTATIEGVTTSIPVLNSAEAPHDLVQWVAGAITVSVTTVTEGPAGAASQRATGTATAPSAADLATTSTSSGSGGSRKLDLPPGRAYRRNSEETGGPSLQIPRVRHYQR